MPEGRPEVLLHEPLWKIPSQTPDSMETGFADFENNHGHHTGNLYYEFVCLFSLAQDESVFTCSAT